ncbi:cell division protein ZipA [Shewanella dokdonensis]|uniref:Cell division protein ZipA n=1 Tax=Shewanella dokdonensis TaxID=712036 RepID=A0ABX8DF35_9GAMM|nr:cell division protein ZipA [Shewanella dokdonensis]MCL1074853.1 cell division protein ZipA [Shewanella dokdonensis]QVK23321.1 cell division protein ZipA [Shewanella dokdonensis]
MEYFRLVLAVLAAIAIIAVLVHGFWSIRKQQAKPLKEKPMTDVYREAAARRDQEGFDADGIGEVRVRKTSPDDKPPKLKSNRIRPENHKFKPLADEQEPISLVETDDDDIADDFELSASAERSRKSNKASRQEPLLGDEELYEEELQMELGLADEHAPTATADFSDTAEPAKAAAVPASATPAQDAAVEPRDVLVLHVVARPGKTLSGAELLPCLLALNFKYGDMQIFHRHEDHAGHGKVLFSLANMVKPGVFDPDDMEQFTTHGVVLFMTLPCASDPVMSFSIMLNSASQLADDLDALLLDGQRNPWQLSTKKEYLERIKANG